MEQDKARADFQEGQAMTHLVTGSQVLHNGVPVQLLYRVALTPSGETWRVRPLFVEEPDREDRFTPSDAISFLHTMRAHRCQAA